MEEAKGLNKPVKLKNELAEFLGGKLGKLGTTSFCLLYHEDQVDQPPHLILGT